MSKYKRVLLKLSGEALAGDKGTGFDEATCVPVAKQIKDLVDAGTEVAIVIGGGNFWRGRSSETIDRTKADQIGMMATVMNCIYMSDNLSFRRTYDTSINTIFLWFFYEVIFQRPRQQISWQRNGSILCRWNRTSVFFNRYRNGTSCD